MKKYILIPLLMALALSGCRSSRSVVQHFYLLEPPAEHNMDWPEGLSVIPGSCEILNVNIASAYASHRIAVREDSHQIRYFSFHEWAVRPDQDLSRLLIGFLETHSVFEQIEYGRLVFPADYILETKVKHMELDNRQKTFHARLHVDFRLFAADRENTFLYHHVADRFQELEKKNINEFVAAVGKLFMEELQSFSIGAMQEIGGNH